MKPSRPDVPPIVAENAREALALLEQFLSSLDALRASAQGSDRPNILYEVRSAKEAVASTRVLSWLRELGAHQQNPPKPPKRGRRP